MSLDHKQGDADQLLNDLVETYYEAIEVTYMYLNIAPHICSSHRMYNVHQYQSDIDMAWKANTAAHLILSCIGIFNWIL